MTNNRNIENFVQNKPLTSVVILSYNRTNDLKQNIESLYANTNLPFEVILFDNNSERDTLEYLRTIKNRTKNDGNGKIKVTYSDTNLGCSGGRKKAVKQAKGDYIYTIDNDMTYTSGWLEELIKRVESDSKIGGASSRIVFPNGRIQLNGGKLRLENGYFGSFDEVDQGKDENDPNIAGEIDCDWLCGGATIYKREVVEKVEHAPGYLNGFEDYDYSFQVADLGYRLVNCPNSVVYHHHISLDKSKLETERSYLSARWDSERVWSSLVYFLERTGINMIKPSGFFNWVESDGSKPFLKWGTVKGMESGYQDLFPGVSLSRLTNKEIRQQFDHIVKTNKKYKKKIREEEVRGLGLDQKCRGVINSLGKELDESFSRYNKHNLAEHLNWILSDRIEESGKLSNKSVGFLVEEIRKNVVEKDSKKAQEFYFKLKKQMSDLII